MTAQSQQAKHTRCSVREDKKVSTGNLKSATRKGLSWFQKISYGSGNFAANMMNNTVGTFISYYYTDVAGLPLAAVGIILLLCRLLDGVSDLIMGVVVENTHTKYGKARPWLLRLAIPYGVCIFLMFFSPGWGVTGKIIYAAATYMAGVALVYTAISVPYNTLSALVTKDQNERTDLATMRQLFGFIGPLFVSTLTMPVVNALGDTQMAWSVVTAVYGILGAALYLLVFFTSKEIDAPEAESVQKEKQHFNMKETLASIKELFKNQYWLMVLGITLLIFISYGVGGGVQVYYCKYILGNSNYQSALSLAGQIPNIALCFIIPTLAQKFGKRNVRQSVSDYSQGAGGETAARIIYESSSL